MYTKRLSGLKLGCHLTYFAAAARTLKICILKICTASNKLMFFAFY